MALSSGCSITSFIITNQQIHGKASSFSRKLHTSSFASARRHRGACPSVSCAMQGLSSKGPASPADASLQKLLEGGDFTARVLSEQPSQVEPKYLIGGRLYSVHERELLKAPFWKKLALFFNVLGGRGKVAKTKRESEVSQDSGRSDSTSKKTAKPVYLADLLREYKGELYVPEEAFIEQSGEIVSFRRDVVTLPKMSLQDFLKFAKANQVSLLTSRGFPISKKYSYREFIVDLTRIPGEQSLHTTRWALQLTQEEAEIALKEYSGPQVEVEAQYMPYVVAPPTDPNPIAAAISGRIVLELAVASGLIATMAYMIGGIAAGAALMGVTIATILMVYVVYPLLVPLLWPFGILLKGLFKGFLFLLLGDTQSSNMSRRGLSGLIVNIYRFFTSGYLFSNLRLLGVIVFVAGCMALLAKFTLTRRPKDFTKWDLWQAIEFGQSKPQARVEGSTGVFFSDIAGIDEAVEELLELVDYLKNPERFNEMGTRPPHGVLLEGPPGCGKTLLAKAIAGEAGVPFYQMAGSEFVEVLVGVGAARVRDLFKRAKVNRPSVVFIDEIDALGAMRQGGDGEDVEFYNAGSQERETTLNQLLIELDGFDTGKGVIFLGATNRMDMLDPALLRPGRFDRKITIKPPRAKGRLEILKVHAKNVKISSEVDLWTIAKNLPGWSGAELAQLLQESAMMAVRNGHTEILQKDLEQAIDRITVGPQRMGVGRGLPVHKRMATLEVGLAMTTHLLCRLEGAKLEYCERISIVPRGQTLSRTIFERLDDEGYFFERKPQLLHRMQVFLGGRAAEEVMFGRDTSNWSVAYLQDASWMARKLISIWNLEGPMAIHGEKPPWKRKPQFTGPPLDFEGWLYDDYEFVEPPFNHDMDTVIAKHSDAFINKMYTKVSSMLQEHRAALTKAVYVILDKEEIYGWDLDFILDHYPAGSSIEAVENEMDRAALPSDGTYSSMQGKFETTEHVFIGLNKGLDA